jgi:hypothetical protein
VLSRILAAGLVLGATVMTDFEASAGKNPLALRIAKAEAELCLSLCPPITDKASSDWLRSDEGRRANACPMSCRVEQPGAALFRRMIELATSKNLEPEAPAIKALGANAPDQIRRLQTAARDVEGRRLGSLCTRARKRLVADEAIFLECMGRTPRAEGPQAVRPPDVTRALPCSVAFTEREADWLKRCTYLEDRIDLEGCVQSSDDDGAPRRQRKIALGAKERCEERAVETLAAAFRVSPRR